MAASASRDWTGAALALLLVLFVSSVAARAADSPIYTITGVPVDATDKDANQAKVKAISEAQVKAFAILAERLGGEKAMDRFRSLSAVDIGRMMSSLSIEEERTGPGRYIGRLTIRFLPRRIREVMSRAGISYTEDRAPPMVVLPLWKTPEGPVAWQDNPWRDAWLSLNAQNSVVPLIIPLGDLADTQTISAEEALAGDRPKLDALRLRYSAETILVAVAEPEGEASIRATMDGDSPLGKMAFDRVYEGEGGGIEAASQLAARRFHTVMLQKWTKSREPTAPAASAVQVLTVAVPFASIEEWTNLRDRILSTRGVAGVDVSTLSAQGAMVRLRYAVPIETLRAALAGRRLALAMEGNTWVLRAP